jgi:hypothetical protein
VTSPAPAGRPEPEWVTLKQAAERFGGTIHRYYRAVTRKHLPCRVARNRILVPLDAARDYANRPTFHVRNADRPRRVYLPTGAKVSPDPAYIGLKAAQFKFRVGDKRIRRLIAAGEVREIAEGGCRWVHEADLAEAIAHPKPNPADKGWARRPDAIRFLPTAADLAAARRDHFRHLGQIEVPEGLDLETRDGELAFRALCGGGGRRRDQEPTAPRVYRFAEMR